LLQLRFIERWDGVLPRLVSGDNGLLTMLSIPSDGMLGDTPAATRPRDGEPVTGTAGGE